METPTLSTVRTSSRASSPPPTAIAPHYVEAGKDNPESLLLVHGGGIDIGMDLYRWYPVVLPLAEKFHVYAIDELGHGETDPPRDTADLWRPTVRAEHVISFIEAMDLGPVNLVGQSTGGWIVTYITIKRPDLVKKLVLIDSGSTAGSALSTDEKSPKQVEVDGAMVEVKDGVLPYMKEVFEEGTMHPKEGLTSTREGIRKFVSTYIYAKHMVTDEWVEHLYKFAQKWNDLYFTHKGKEFWDNTNMKEHSKEFYVDGGAHPGPGARDPDPDAGHLGQELQQGRGPRTGPLQAHPGRPASHLRQGQPLPVAGPPEGFREPGDLVSVQALTAEGIPPHESHRRNPWRPCSTAPTSSRASS